MAWRIPRFTTLQLLLAAALCGLVLGLFTTSWRSGGYAQVTALRYSPSGKYLAANYTTGSSRVWNVELPRPRLIVEIPAASPWDYHFGEQLYFADDTTLIDIQTIPTSAGSSPTHVRAIDVRTGAITSQFPIPAGSYDGIYTAAGDTVAVANLPRGGIDIYSLRSGKLTGQVAAGPVAYGLSLTPDGRTLVVPNQRGKILVCDVTTGNTIYSLAATGVTTASISPNGQRLAHVGWPASTIGSFVALFEFPSTTQQIRMDADHLHPTWVAFTADGSRLAVAGDEAAEIYDLDRNRIVGRVAFGSTAPTAWNTLKTTWRSGGGLSPFALSPDGQRLASYDGGSVLLWDTRTGKLRATMADHRRTTQIVVFTLGLIAWSIAWGVVTRRLRATRLPEGPTPLELKLSWGLMFIGGMLAIGAPVAVLLVGGPLTWPPVCYSLVVGIVAVACAAGRSTISPRWVALMQMSNLIACDPVNFVLGVLAQALLRRPHVQHYLRQANTLHRPNPLRQENTAAPVTALAR